MAQDKMSEAFEAVVLRYVHDARVGESLNIGVVMVPRNSPPRSQFLDRWSRITGAFPGADVVALRRLTKAIERVVSEDSSAQHQLTLGATAAHPALNLVARAIHVDDTSIQLSPTISGVTSDVARTERELFELYVDQQAAVSGARPTRNDQDVWKQFAQLLDETTIRRVQHEKVIHARRLNLVFEQSWINGRQNVLQPLSFDMADANAISGKAQKWVGGLVAARTALENTGVYLLVGLPDQAASHQVRAAANDAVEMMTETLAEQLPRGVEVVREAERDRLARKILDDLASTDAHH